ncbi:MAG: hypothetical protein ABDH37_03345 [Candidatus Hydrothermales bacterium]
MKKFILIVRFFYILFVIFGLILIVTSFGITFLKIKPSGFEPIQPFLLISGILFIILSYSLNLFFKKRIKKLYTISAIFSIFSFLLGYWYIGVEERFNPVLYGFFNKFWVVLAILIIFFIFCLFLFFALFSLRLVLKEKKFIKPFIFSHLYIVLLIFFSCLILEKLSSFTVPPWPYYKLRPMLVTKEWAQRIGGKFNSFGLRDKERKIRKSYGKKRIIFLGDSFLEGIFCKNTLSGYCEDSLLKFGINFIECVNFGVSNTDIRHYFYRLKEIGLKMSPDAVFLFFASQNDFVKVGYGNKPIPLVAEHPLPSLLGKLMPRFTWLVINRTQFPLFVSKARKVKDEFEYLKEVARLPYSEGVRLLSEYMSKFYFPDVHPEKIEEILRRGGENLWNELKEKKEDQEYLTGKWIESLIKSALRKEKKGRMDTKVDFKMVEATASWILKMNEELKKKNIVLYVFLIPFAIDVDPSYKEYFKAFINEEDFKSQRILRERLFDLLKSKGVNVIDLKEVLNGIERSYRKWDSHFTEKGHRIVAKKVLEIIDILFLK